MPTPARFRQSDLERAIKAAQRTGVADYKIKFEIATGTFEMIVGRAARDTSNDPVELD